MEIEFSHNANKRSPVVDFLQEVADLDPKAQKRIHADLENIHKYSIDKLLQAEILKKMKGYEKYKLYEYCRRFNKLHYRILCCIHNNTCYVIHAFKKKENKTRSSDINTAVSRIISLNLLQP